MFALFLSSGLFLGWSLGANDAANVFGTAVGSRMISFRKAALFCGAFVILGAVISGAGASETLGELGAVNAIAGAFVVALAAAITVYWLTILGYPVSTTQAIVGAIIGWDLFSGALIDFGALETILLSWIVSPILAAVFSMILYKLIAVLIRVGKIHMFTLDNWTRTALLLTGIAGSYSLGANNISNVVGVFVPVAPFSEISFLGLFVLTGAQQLFFIGAVAIAVGVFTYGKKVMLTVGEGITDVSPVAAFVAVLANAVVLFLFASQDLKLFLDGHGLPSFPLVPVSSSQAIVGSVIGIGLVKGGRGIRWRMLGEITGAWIATPIAAIVISFVSLFFLQNVFQQKTYIPVEYAYTVEVADFLQQKIKGKLPAKLQDKTYPTAQQYRKALLHQNAIDPKDIPAIMAASELTQMVVQEKVLNKLNHEWFTRGQRQALQALTGQSFRHKWQLNQALAHLSPEWRLLSSDKKAADELKNKLAYLYRILQSD